MRWSNAPKSAPRKCYWNQEFAWWPVRLENKSETVWLEWVWAHHDRIGDYSAVDFVRSVSRYRDDVWEGSCNLTFKDGAA